MLSFFARQRVGTGMCRTISWVSTERIANRIRAASGCGSPLNSAFKSARTSSKFCRSTVCGNTGQRNLPTTAPMNKPIPSPTNVSMIVCDETACCGFRPTNEAIIRKPSCIPKLIPEIFAVAKPKPNKTKNSTRFIARYPARSGVRARSTTVQPANTRQPRNAS